MPGPFVHEIDPVIFSVGGVHAWWYGLSYSLGFLNAHLALRRNGQRLGLSAAMVYELTLLLAVGVLAGGRAVVVHNEWSFYRENLSLIPSLWLGGLATHGLIIGGAVGVLAFCVVRRQPFRPIFDALAIPVAVILGCGRIGNFIDGQIVGSVTSVPWAVKFPGAEGFRHPVVLYDGLKNLLLVPYLLRVRATNPTPGATAARFVFWYASLRIVLDLFRDYPTHRLALGTGQTLNLVMASVGALLLVRSRWRRLGRLRHSAVPEDTSRTPLRAPLWWQPVLLTAILVFCLFIPSNWTQNVPERYGSRHPGLRHSWVYPDIDTTPRTR